MKLSKSQQEKGGFENPQMSEFRSNIGKWLDVVAKDGWIKLYNRSRPNMILMTETKFLELLDNQKVLKNERLG